MTTAGTPLPRSAASVDGSSSRTGRMMRPSTRRCFSSSMRWPSTSGTPPESVSRTEKPADVSTLSAPRTIAETSGFVMSEPTNPTVRVDRVRRPCASTLGV